MTEQGIVIKEEKEDDYIAYENVEQCSYSLGIKVENIKEEEEVVLEDLCINNNACNAYETENQCNYSLGIKVENFKVENEAFSDDIYMNNKENYIYSTNQCEDSLAELRSLHQDAKKTKIGVTSKKYQCAYCNYFYTSRLLFKKHIKKELYKRNQATLKILVDRVLVAGKNNGRSGKFACKDCDFRSKFNSSLKRHILYQHTANESFSCSICRYITNTKQNLKFHIKYKHLEGRKLHTCPQCDFKASTNNHLKRHILLVHSATPKPFTCPLCEYRTAQSHHLKRHVLSHHSDEKPFSCHICDYATKREAVLKRHIDAIHMKAKPFVCHQHGCTFKTARKSYLKSHFIVKHKKEKHFNCPYCPYRSSFTQAIKKHVFKVHSTSET